MSSIIQGYEYDIFISYRQKDNKYDGWVTEFVNNLRKELEATFKEDLSIYTDDNPKDGLLETHIVDKSLEGKLKSLIFIPIISQTYCDPKSFAWTHELCAFNKLAKEDQFGRDIKFSNGNVASRILPVKIHDLDPEDKRLLENELGGVMRAVEFIYKEAGVNRPLKPSDNKNDNQNKTDYRNQVNKVANAVKEIITSIKMPSSTIIKSEEFSVTRKPGKGRKLKLTSVRYRVFYIILSVLILSAAALYISKKYFSEKNSYKINIIAAKPKAYELYTKVQYRLNPFNPVDLDSCIFFLTKAIEADSLFALAHAELSRAYSFKNYFFYDPKADVGEKAFIEAQKSLYLNPDLAEGYFARAYSTWNFQNKFPHEKIIREYKKAISLKPDMDEAYHYLGIVYVHTGLIKESIKAFRKSLQINPDNKVAAADLVSTWIFSGNIADLNRSLDLFKQIPEDIMNPLRYSFWATALINLDRLDEADSVLSAGLRKDSTDLFLNSALSLLLIKKGDKNGAMKIIEYCEKSSLNRSHYHHVVYNLAAAYALLGNFEKSVNDLNWVAENGFPDYTLFRDDPFLKSMHQYQPYKDLMNKLKISWQKFGQIARE